MRSVSMWCLTPMFRFRVSIVDSHEFREVFQYFFGTGDEFSFSAVLQMDGAAEFDIFPGTV